MKTVTATAPRAGKKKDGAFEADKGRVFDPGWGVSSEGCDMQKHWVLKLNKSHPYSFEVLVLGMSIITDFNI